MGREKAWRTRGVLATAGEVTLPLSCAPQCSAEYTLHDAITLKVNLMFLYLASLFSNFIPSLTGKSSVRFSESRDY